MTLKAQMLVDVESVFFNTDEFAADATYTPRDGDAVLITIMKESSDQTIMVGYNPASDSMVINVMASEVPTPQRGDVFVVDSESWYLVKNLSGGEQEGVFTIEVSRSDKRQV